MLMKKRGTDKIWLLRLLWKIIHIGRGRVTTSTVLFTCKAEKFTREPTTTYLPRHNVTATRFRMRIVINEILTGFFILRKAEGINELVKECITKVFFPFLFLSLMDKNTLCECNYSILFSEQYP